MFRKNWPSHAKKLTELRNKCENYPYLDKQHAKLLGLWSDEIDAARDFIKIEASTGKADSNQTRLRHEFLNGEIDRWNAQKNNRQERLREYERGKLLAQIIGGLARR